MRHTITVNADKLPGGKVVQTGVKTVEIQFDGPQIDESILVDAIRGYGLSDVMTEAAIHMAIRSVMDAARFDVLKTAMD